MKERFLRYILDLYDDAPEALYLSLLIVLFLGCVLFLILFGVKRGWRMASRLLLAEYVIIIFSVTVFFRGALVEQRISLIPFWSYWKYFEEGRMNLIVGNILNVIVFIPIGVLLGLSIEEIKPKFVLLLGLLLSFSVEIMQFVTVRGLAEFDDLMHNTIGCILGYGIFWMIRAIVRRVSMNREMINREI